MARSARVTSPDLTDRSVHYTLHVVCYTERRARNPDRRGSAPAGAVQWLGREMGDVKASLRVSSERILRSSLITTSC